MLVFKKSKFRAFQDIFLIFFVTVYNTFAVCCQKSKQFLWNLEFIDDVKACFFQCRSSHSNQLFSAQLNTTQKNDKYETLCKIIFPAISLCYAVSRATKGIHCCCSAVPKFWDGSEQVIFSFLARKSNQNNRKSHFWQNWKRVRMFGLERYCGTWGRPFWMG